jgi:hypothetical protein
MRELLVSWQRLIDDAGKTCPRCRGTGLRVRTAAVLLQVLLAHRAVRVRGCSTALSEEDFAKDPLSSNMVFINDTAIEDLLRGEVGKSQCCSACGESDCRTVTVSGQTYETIPVSLIVRAGLIAARRMRRKTNSP